MTDFEQTRPRTGRLVVFGLATLLAPGLAGAHGAPEVDGAPEGIIKATITEQPDIPGLNAIILDAPRPGILLKYRGGETLTVLGTDDEAFLRFEGMEVWANTQSGIWQALPNMSTETDQAAWVPLSESGSYGWLDPRIGVMEDSHHKDTSEKWMIKVRTSDGNTQHIAGTLTYLPINQ